MNSWDSELERQLARHLSARGIIAVREFKVPGSRYIFDFFLPAPPFGVIEIKSALAYHQSGVVSSMIGQALAQFEVIRANLGSDARLYLAVVGKAEFRPSSPDSLPRGIVLCTADNIEAVADLIAADFRVHAIRLPGKPASSLLTETLATDSDDLTATLRQLTLNLDCLFLDEGRSVLESEIGSLQDEIGHQHFTSAALRIGRSLEFIIYSACKSWAVPVSEPVLIGLDKLNVRFRDLKDALLNYSAIEADADKKKEAKRKFVDKTSALQSTLNQIMSDIDEQVAVQPEERKSPINPGALLTDIRNRYARLNEVRDAIDAQRKPLRGLLDLRNDAAHASVEGSSREVTRIELQTMVGLLNEILLHLSKCGTAIELFRKNQEGPRA